MLENLQPTTRKFIDDVIDLAKRHVQVDFPPRPEYDHSTDDRHLIFIAVAWLVAVELFWEEKYEAAPENWRAVYARARALSKHNHASQWRSVVFNEAPDRMPIHNVGVGYGYPKRPYVVPSASMAGAEPLWAKYIQLVCEFDKETTYDAS